MEAHGRLGTEGDGMEQATYTVDEFCQAHRIGRAFFYELLKRGDAPACIKLGRRRLISKEAAAKWRRQRERKASPRRESR